MSDSMNNVVYKAFGFTVRSEIPLPELLQQPGAGEAGASETSEASADIVIEVQDAARLWRSVPFPPSKFAAAPGLVVFEVPDMALFSIRNGRQITVSPLAGYEADTARLYLLGSCMGAILMQRRILPLHGSAIAIDGQAYAITGESGAGKSTLAATFLNQGYQLLSDDVIAVSFSSDHIPYVTPAYPQQKLWQESLAKFGMESGQYRPIQGRENKYCVPVPAKFCTESLPLAGVYELVKSDSSEIGISRIDKLDRFQTLFRHTYRNNFISSMGLVDWHFHFSASLLNHIHMYQLSRPAYGFSAPQLAAIIQDIISGGINDEPKPKHFAG